MSVSNLTNGCKMATIELSQLDKHDLELACLARLTALSHLRMHTPDQEDRAGLGRTVARMNALLRRLQEL